MTPTHGGTGTRLFYIWRAIKKRCYNPNEPRYPDYGGRGITVCPGWQAYEPFRDWALTNGYDDTLTIDRVDNDGNYEPGNCRWITLAAQARNKRDNRLITAFGETKILAEWVRDPRCSVTHTSILRRLDSGWSTERALTAPDQKGPLRTHCIKDHELTPENIYTNSRGVNECRTCRRDRQRARA